MSLYYHPGRWITKATHDSYVTFTMATGEEKVVLFPCYCSCLCQHHGRYVQKSDELIL